MAEKFAKLAAHAKESWSEDAHQVYEAAGEVFTQETSVREQLGQDFAQARRNLSMTQGQLAQASGIPQAEISRIETGRSNPTLETAARLAKVLNKNLELT